MLPEPVQPLY